MQLNLVDLRRKTISAGSGAALEWMVDCACEVPGDLRFDPNVLRTWPSATGPQHDQVKAGFGWLTRIFHVTWPAGVRRRSPKGAILHESVYDRFDAAAVPYWDGFHPYQPETFRGYADVEASYRQPMSSGTKAERRSAARKPKPASARNANVMQRQKRRIQIKQSNPIKCDRSRFFPFST